MDYVAITFQNMFAKHHGVDLETTSYDADENKKDRLGKNISKYVQTQSLACRIQLTFRSFPKSTRKGLGQG